MSRRLCVCGQEFCRDCKETRKLAARERYRALLAELRPLETARRVESDVRWRVGTNRTDVA